MITEQRYFRNLIFTLIEIAHLPQELQVKTDMNHFDKAFSIQARYGNHLVGISDIYQA